MSEINTISGDVLQAVSNVAGTYQIYQDNFNDEKYKEINESFVQPLIKQASDLMSAFEDINKTNTQLSNRGVITEES